MKQSLKQHNQPLLISLFIILSPSCWAAGEHQLPSPTWLSKAPLKCKPDHGWWLQWKANDMNEETITRSAMHDELVSFNDLEKAITDQKSTRVDPAFAIIVFDPWVPWESDLHYLKTIPCHKNFAFYTQQSEDELSPIAASMAIHRDKTKGITNIVNHVYPSNDNSNNERSENALEQSYLAALRTAIYTESKELFLSMISNKVNVIGQALTNTVFRSVMQNHGMRVTLIYKPDASNRDAKIDFAFFDQLLELFDAINNTHYHNDRPIRYFIFSYLKWAYQYETEKAVDELKPETEAALHHIAEQMNILLKKLV